MKIAKISLIMLGAAGAGVPVCQNGEPALDSGTQEQRSVQESADADKLYDLVKQARADLRQMRVAAELGSGAAGLEARQVESRERGEGGGEHGGREGRGEGAERGGEHGQSSAGGEDEGAYLPKMTRQKKLFANGARLVLAFDPRTQVFAGSVTNTTARTLPQVRVEVHLDNGTELGPTKRIDVAPGQTVPVELGAFGNEFSAWVSHPEAGVEAGHGGGGEEGGEEGAEEGAEGAGEHGGGEGRGGEADEHGGGEGTRPRGAAYRPVYNQLQILRGEMQAFAVDLAAKSSRNGR